MAKSKTPRHLVLLALFLGASTAVSLESAVAASQSTQSRSSLAEVLNTDLTLNGGLVVHVGCGNGTLTAQLAVSPAFTIHGLDTDASNVMAARQRIQSAGLYGQVAVDQWNGHRLPYVNNLVNLLVVSDSGAVTRDELLRVLSPDGVALIAQPGSNGWTRVTKPRSDDIDDWSHYLHGPDNNAVANDTVIGPPRHLQWQCGPKWTRHHDKMSSFSAMVSSGGRIFYIIDEGSSVSIYLPSHWALIARDAFNGKQLWKRSIDPWFSRFKGLKDGPADAPRRLVAAEGRVYATLDLTGPVVALDAMTGDTVREYAGTEGAEEIVLSNKVLFVLIGPGSIADGRRETRPVENRSIQAIDATTGKTLWRHSDVVASLTMAVDNQHVYYFNFDSQNLRALNRATGQLAWTSADTLPTPKVQRSFFASKLVVSDSVVLFASGEYSGLIKSTGGATKSDTLTAVSAENGETLWSAKHPPSGYSSPEDLYVIDGTVWCGRVSSGSLDGMLFGWDLKTGEVKHQFAADKENYWFHHRCYSGRATCNYILTSRTGVEFIDFRNETWDLNHWVRGACLYGLMPANGLIYSPPAPCICYAETMLHSFNALAPAKAKLVPILPDDRRLTKGPAFETPLGIDAQAGDWPTFRGTNSRSGVSKTPGPNRLAVSWTTSLGGPLSTLTAADNKVFVAAIERHEVICLSSRDGKVQWRYTAGGRVDSPPTFYKGRVLFGSADGCVYCLRADDGQLIWRFQAAWADQRTLIDEQIESLWPVHGSILVRDGLAHFVAGRSAFVDGGMRLYRIDVKTGRIVSTTVLNDKNPRTGENVQDTVKWLNMAVGRPDVLSCDGKRIYMRSQAFDLAGQRLDMGPQIANADEGKRQGGETTHLFCPTGFLDDSWFHRTYWLFGQTWSSGWCGYHVAGKFAPAGKIMSIGEDMVYVFGREPEYYKWTVPMEYRLFASKKTWTAKTANAAGKPKQDASKGKKKRRSAGPTPVTNTANYQWSTKVPILARALVVAEDRLYIAGPRDLLDESQMPKTPDGADNREAIAQEAALTGEAGGLMWSVSTQNGVKLSEIELDSPPVFDGLIAANGSLFLSTVSGNVIRLSRD